MNIFSKTLQFASIFNLTAGILLTVIGFCSENAFKGGTLLNQIGLLFSVEAFGIMLVSIVIFSIINGDSKIDGLLSLKWSNIIMYIVFGANVVYRLFFHNNSELENGFSATGDKVLAGIALSLILNLTILIISSNFIKSYK